MPELTKEEISLIVSALNSIRCLNQKVLESIPDLSNVSYFLERNRSVDALIKKINS